MIDVDKIRQTIVCGLKDTLGVPVIRSNTPRALPKLPFCSYTIQSLLKNSEGTWQRIGNGIDRIPARQVWSITVNISPAQSWRFWLMIFSLKAV